jgi:16S rRNA (uracil1498-N3)-methyltransferase
MMRIPRFYWPNLNTDSALQPLPEAVHRHAVQVLRLKTGDLLHVFDGQGHEFVAMLEEVEKRRSSARITGSLVPQAPPTLPVTLLQGISKGDRMDFAIQKAVELGVSAIVPVITERCNVQLRDQRAEMKHQHWQGIIISACEQSGRAEIPTLHQPTVFEEALLMTTGLKLVLDPTSDATLTSQVQPEAVSLLIGPEGGLSDDEVAQAKQAGFNTVQFGPRILRTETAALAALAVVQAQWGDLA